MPAINAKALALPDPLLVRYYRDGIIEEITKVHVVKRTRAITVTRGPGVIDKWRWLPDVGWVPDA